MLLLSLLISMSVQMLVWCSNDNYLTYINSTFVGSTWVCMSSTYLFKLQRHGFNVGIRSSSSDAMNLYASKGPNGEPTTTPLPCI